MAGVNLGLGTDLEQVLLQRIDLHLAYRHGRSHKLPVHVRGANAVLVHYRDMANARAHKALNAPAAHSADAEHYHPGLRQPPGGGLAYQQAGAGLKGRSHI